MIRQSPLSQRDSKNRSNPEDELTAWQKKPIKDGIAYSIFSLLLISMLCVAFITCTELVSFEATRKMSILTGTIIVISFTWFAFSIGGKETNVVTLFRLAFYGILFASPIMAMVLTNLEIFFWMSLLLISVLAIYLVFQIDDYRDFWKFTRKICYILWIIIGITISMGNTPFFPYASIVFTLAEYHFLLDIRYLITVVLALLLIVDATIKAIRIEPPIISLIPVYPLEDISTEVHAIIRNIVQPFVTVINLIWSGIMILINTLWGLIASVSVYLYRIGKNIADELRYFFSEKDIWNIIYKTLATLAIIVIFSRGVEFISPHFYSYLRTSSFHSIISLLWMTGFFVIIILSILALNFMWTNNKEASNQSILGGAIIVISLALSGAIMYLLGSFNVLNIVGFNSIGIFSSLILVFVVSVIVYQLTTRHKSTSP